ncbi:MAG: MOSC domain-containing protein [Acidobacteriia bacterium]|nr:MOSC domain-containing protein [Terriglobia bacterium]
MKIISINVALPKVIVSNGEEVPTGIFKLPVNGPVRVHALNLEGDGQADLANHGGPNKAVYAYAWNNAQFWKQTLGRDDLHPGSFGENLTVDEFAEDTVAVGDELAIGTARFVVTQPRIPCFKLGIAMGLPAFPKMFLESGRTGFYLRVLDEGIVRAGDNIQKVDNREPARVTVRELAAAVQTLQASDDLLRRIRSLRALSPPMAEWIERKVRARGERLRENRSQQPTVES